MVPFGHRSETEKKLMCMKKERENRKTYTVVGQRRTPRTQEQETVDRTETIAKGVVMKMV